MKNKFRGLTLVELIVGFAILSILMATIASLLPGFVKQYSYVQNSVQADKIGTTILDIVESELSYSTKIVDSLGAKFPLPVEIIAEARVPVENALNSFPPPS